MMHTAIAAPSQAALGTSRSAVSATVAQRPDALVVVQRDWNGWKKAMAPVSALEGVHWRQPQGAPRQLIHAYVNCAALVSGDVPHECADGAPHRLLVCVLKRHTPSAVFEELAARANASASVKPSA
jgi:hypothetical protein